MNARLPLCLRGLAVLLFLAVPMLAQASTLNVPSAYYPTIQSAIYASQDGDTVLVADGTFTGDGNRDIDFSGKNITVKSQHGAAKTIIDCQGSSSSTHRGFYIHSNELKATISGFTVKNGFEYASGGGIDIENFSGGTINIIGCVLTGNTATAQNGGGGISNNNNGGTITLADCTVSGNTTQYGLGGGISNINYVNDNYPASSTHNSTITLTRCTITGNSASFGGGGIHNENPSGIVPANRIDMITLTDCTVTKNTTQYSAGGVDNSNGNNNIISLSNCTVTGNTTTDQYSSGGGIYSYNYNGGTVTLTHCTITGNLATYGGGVINSINGGTITLLDCSISGNTGVYGGGAYNYGTRAGAITLTACTVSGNSATYGGGLYNYNDDFAPFTLTNCTILGNSTNTQYGIGGGIFNSSGIIYLTNCTFTRNAATIVGGIYNDGYQSVLLILLNCIVYADTSEEFSNSSDANANTIATNCDIRGSYSGRGISNIDADPVFVNTAVGDVHLKSTSPCLGAGTSNGAPVADKDGQLRPNPPSIGAYELKVPPAMITKFDLAPNPVDAPGTSLFAFVSTSGIFSKVTVSLPRGNLSIVSPTFSLEKSYVGQYWFGTIPTAFLKLAKTNPVTFIATGTRGDGTTATLTTTLQINNRPTLSLYLYPDTTVVPRNNNFNLYSFVGNFTGVPALYTTVQITLPPGIDYVSSDGAFTYNAATRTLTQGFPSLFFQQFNLVLHTSATASTQKPLTIPIVATCPGFQQAVLSSTVQVVP